MNDAAYMLQILEDGEPHSQMEIIIRSLADRGHGLTPHSRAADLRKQGHYITCDCVSRENGRPVYEYRLLGSLPEGEPAADASRDNGPGSVEEAAAAVGEAPSPSESEPEQLRLSEVA